MTTNTLLNALAEQEIKLHEVAVSAIGTMEQKEHQLREMGVFDDYKSLHQQYEQVSQSRAREQPLTNCDAPGRLHRAESRQRTGQRLQGLGREAPLGQFGTTIEAIFSLQ